MLQVNFIVLAYSQLFANFCESFRGCFFERKIMIVIKLNKKKQGQLAKNVDPNNICVVRQSLLSFHSNNFCKLIECSYYCYKLHNFICTLYCNCNYILFSKLPWLGDSEGTFFDLRIRPPPVYHRRCFTPSL